MMDKLAGQLGILISTDWKLWLLVAGISLGAWVLFLLTITLTRWPKARKSQSGTSPTAPTL